MSTFLTILQLLMPLLKELTDILASAYEASTTKDQARLDTLHEQAITLANARRPAGTDAAV